MDKIITREEVAKMDEEYAYVLEHEAHHDHELITDEHGTVRWKADPVVRWLIDNVDLNDIVMKLYSQGYDKNSEMHRKMYRQMGYSLFGYWEIFYWHANNEDEPNYVADPDFYK